MDKHIGKINFLKVGMGGYQDAMFGVTVDLTGPGWGVGDFKGFWSPSRMPRSEHAKWSDAKRKDAIADTFYWLDQLMKDANVSDANKLVGKPVEATFENGQLVSWRILTEVL